MNMVQMSIFDFLGSEGIEKSKQIKKPKKNVRKNNKRKEMLQKVIDFQNHLYFQEDDKIVAKLSAVHKLEILAYKEETVFHNIRIIIPSNENMFTQAVFNYSRNEFYVFPVEHLVGRKSMWVMAQTQWVWRDFETMEEVIKYIENNVRDDSKEKPWSWLGKDIFAS